MNKKKNKQTKKNPQRTYVVQVFTFFLEGPLLGCLAQFELSSCVYLSFLPACPEVKVNEISTAANLLPSPTGPNEPELLSISLLQRETRTSSPFSPVIRCSSQLYSHGCTTKKSPKFNHHCILKCAHLKVIPFKVEVHRNLIH